MFDAVIKNGLIVDGARTKPYKAALYIKDGKIAEISEDENKAAKAVYDACGHVVAPGFIDIHSHSDVSYFATTTMEGKLIGGVTCEVIGQCGQSAIPTGELNSKLVLESLPSILPYKLNDELFPVHDINDYAKHYADTGVSIDMVPMIGHGSLRSYVVGWEMRQVTPEELKTMCDLLDKMLEQGAAGITFGLIYPPGSFCDTAEVLALAEVVAKHDKVLSVHMRNENKKVFEALDEMIEVALKTGVKLEISHLKLMGSTQFGRTDELFAKIELARAKGVRIHADQYPYTSSSSVLSSSFPKWVTAGGYPAFVERLKDDATFAEMVKDGLPEMYNRGGPENITVRSADNPIPEFVGKNLIQIAEMLDKPLFEAIREVLIRGGGYVSCHYKCMDDDDLLKILARKDVCICSDGFALDLDGFEGQAHPRYTGSFPRGLRLIRENNLMSVEDAVYKVTGLPATLMGFEDRFGMLKPGLDATITVFDYDNLCDNATYTEPTKKPDGIDMVFVRGELVLDHGVFTDARPGKLQLR